MRRLRSVVLVAVWLAFGHAAGAGVPKVVMIEDFTATW
jgi:hypothetical protein